MRAFNIRGGNILGLAGRSLASAGHRGRADARGHRGHAPSGLTRTSGQRVDAPSLDRRAGTAAGGASAWTSASSRAARRQRRRASSITRRSVDTLARRSRQARCPARALAAGIDAASMARRCQNPSKNPRVAPQANVERWPAMRGRGESGEASSRGQGGGGRRPTGDTSEEASPDSPCLPRATQTMNKKGPRPRRHGPFT